MMNLQFLIEITIANLLLIICTLIVLWFRGWLHRLHIACCSKVHNPTYDIEWVPIPKMNASVVDAADWRSSQLGTPYGWEQVKDDFCADTTRSRVAQFMGECSSDSLFEFPFGMVFQVSSVQSINLFILLILTRVGSLSIQLAYELPNSWENALLDLCLSFLLERCI